jgi:hypothetical protein
MPLLQVVQRAWRIPRRCYKKVRLNHEARFDDARSPAD